MEVFDFTDYRLFIDSKIKSYPQKGYGIQSKLAEAIGAHSSFVTSVLKSERQLTPEHAVGVANFFNMTALEKEYFMELVNLDRAGTPALREYHSDKIKILKQKSRSIKDVVKSKIELTQEQKSVYYMDWRFSAIRAACSLPDMTVQKIAEKLNLKESVVRKSTERLAEFGLIKDEGGILVFGPAFVKLDADDPLIYRYHSNWREQALRFYDREEENDLHNTLVLSLSAEDAAKIKASLKKSVEELLKTVEPSPSEELWCLCLDWFCFEKK